MFFSKIQWTYRLRRRLSPPLLSVLWWVYSRAEQPCSALQPRNMLKTYLAAETLFPDSAEQADKLQRTMLENTDPSWRRKIRSFLIQLNSRARLFVTTAVEQWTIKWKSGIKNDHMVPEVMVPWVTTHTSDALCPSLAAAGGCGHSVWAGKHTWHTAVCWSGLVKT